MVQSIADLLADSILDGVAVLIQPACQDLEQALEDSTIMQASCLNARSKQLLASPRLPHATNPLSPLHQLTARRM